MRIVIIFLGLIFWSLGSVVMTRFSDGVTRTSLRGFFFGRSQCPECKHVLKAKNLVPVVSYLVQWGKCEYCWKKISRIYPVLELLCVGIFLITYFLLKDFWTPTLVVWLVTNRLLILLLVYDLKTYELHMIVRMLLMAVWVWANIFLLGNIRNAFFAVMLFGVVFMCIYFFAKRYAKMRFKKNMEWFGEGDVYLAAGIWIFVPILFSMQWISFSWMMLAKTLILFVVLSSIIGLIRAWLQYLITKKSSKIIPFFPAMIIAFWIFAWKLWFFISLVFPLVW